jgi:N-glycosylase/DNA lyase
VISIEGKGIKKRALDELFRIYKPVRGEIAARLEEFENVWKKGSDEDIFAELTFCLLTPQSRAKTCWVAIGSLREKGLLTNCDCKRIAGELRGVRFPNNKARYVVAARRQFMAAAGRAREGAGRRADGSLAIKSKIRSFGIAFEAREWLVDNTIGMGYKEASHFLRNIGMGKDIAILDRHVLKNLKLLGVIDTVPMHIPKKKYLEIEEMMRRFAINVKIPLNHLDLLLWYREAGEIFK